MANLGRRGFVLGFEVVDKDAILKKAVSVEGKINPSVYALIDGNEIVYVGKSTNPYSRIGTHLLDKKFDKFAILHGEDFSIEDEEFNKLYQHFEELLIMKFKPKYNQSIDCLIYVSPDKLKKETGLGKTEINKLVTKYKIGYSVLQGLIYYLRIDIQEAFEKEYGNEAR
jgi:hypothetical protein